MGPQRPSPAAQAQMNVKRVPIVGPKILKISQGSSGPKVENATPIVREHEIIKKAQGETEKANDLKKLVRGQSMPLSDVVILTINQKQKSLQSKIKK